MPDAEAHGVQHRTDRGRVAKDANRPLLQWPSGATKSGAADGGEANDAVTQLAGALRTAERAHRAYRAELRLGDVEPADHWSTWYAEYLLGLR